MFSIGGAELLVIALLVLIFFGPDALPEIGRILGKAYRWLVSTSEELTEMMEESGAGELADLAGVERRGVLGFDESAESPEMNLESDADTPEDPDDYLGDTNLIDTTDASQSIGELPEYLEVDDYLGGGDG